MNHDAGPASNCRSDHLGQGASADNALAGYMHYRSLAALLCAGFALLACKPKEDAPSLTNKAEGATTGAARAGDNRSGRPQNVTTTQTRSETVPLLLEAQGSVLSLDEVDLRPQKNGTIREVLVREGSEVRRGQLLFTLDDREDQANVEKAAAAVAGAEAALSVARRDLNRTQELSNQSFVSSSALDTQKNKVEVAEAQLVQAKAALDQAKVSLSYSRITAPFDGRAGRVDVRPGALVNASSTQTALLRITRMHPIGVSFTLPENNLQALLEAQRKGPVKVTAMLGAQREIQGEVSFIDSSVDRNSGTILLKARMDNSARLVWPGQYVTVKVAAGVIDKATVLPAQAVINGPDGRLVYVVKDDATVEARPVELLRIVDQKAVIKGIEPGLKVVLEGGQNLRPGVKVAEAGDKPAGERKRDGSAQDKKTQAAAQ